MYRVKDGGRRPAGHPVFAWLTHQVLAHLEPGWLRALRVEMASRAFGVVAEVGAGTGANLKAYPPGRVRAVIAVEPDPYMRRYLRAAARSASVPVTVLGGRAEALPLRDASVDTLLFSLVLCSVQDPQATLAEARRTLRPQGRLLMLEHVASPSPAWRRLQRALNPAWKRVAAGCHLDRETLALAAQSGFEVSVLQRVGGALHPVVMAEGAWGAGPPARGVEGPHSGWGG